MGSLSLTLYVEVHPQSLLGNRSVMYLARLLVRLETFLQPDKDIKRHYTPSGHPMMMYYAERYDYFVGISQHLTLISLTYVGAGRE